MLSALALGLVHGGPPPRHHLHPSRAAELRCMEDVSLTDKIAATTDSAKAFSDEPAVIDADAATARDRRSEARATSRCDRCARRAGPGRRDVQTCTPDKYKNSKN